RLFESAPPEYRLQLVGSGAILSCDHCACFAQSMSGAVLKSCFVAPLAKLVTEARSFEWFAKLGDEERRLSGWRGLDDLLQHRQNRQCECHRPPPLVLLLREPQI